MPMSDDDASLDATDVTCNVDVDVVDIDDDVADIDIYIVDIDVDISDIYDGVDFDSDIADFDIDVTDVDIDNADTVRIYLVHVLMLSMLKLILLGINTPPPGWAQCHNIRCRKVL